MATYKLKVETFYEAEESVEIAFKREKSALIVQEYSFTKKSTRKFLIPLHS